MRLLLENQSKTIETKLKHNIITSQYIDTTTPMSSLVTPATPNSTTSPGDHNPDPNDPPILSTAHVSSSPHPNGQRFCRPVSDLARNRRRRLTSFKIDAHAGEARNVILPLDQLMEFLTENFSCKKCRTVIEDGALSLEIFGLACGINYNCSCKATASL
jgi:hypothetical protein